MKIKELSIGDWVEYKPKCSPAQVATLRYGGVFTIEGKDFAASTSLKHIAPIPISAEALKQNGWNNDKVDPNFWATDGLYIYNHNGVWRLRPKSTELLIVVDVKHIHELQHALRLLGVEKEIEL